MVKEHEIFKKIGKNGQLTFENIFSLKTTEKKKHKIFKIQKYITFYPSVWKKVLKFEHSWYWQAREKNSTVGGGKFTTFQEKMWHFVE